MQASPEPVRLLANTMNYLDRSYRQDSILEWVRTTPEGAAYSVVRDAFIRLVEETSIEQHIAQAA